ncbi:MAG: MEDS domain-containing protein [Chloroflexi bacterium]|nr:MEDS domain-containing protein [Chloroflexota bacterium]
MKDGFDRGDKAIHVVNPQQRDDHLRRLAAAGIDTAAAERRGQFELRANTDTYLRNGGFDQDRMLAVFEQLASGNAKHGFPRSRIVCRMDWAAESRVFVDNVIEFESRVNDVWRRHDDAVICTYHLGRFSGDAVIYFRDPLLAPPYSPDIAPLLRVCDIYNVPMATNIASAWTTLYGIALCLPPSTNGAQPTLRTPWMARDASN